MAVRPAIDHRSGLFPANPKVYLMQILRWFFVLFGSALAAQFASPDAAQAALRPAAIHVAIGQDELAGLSATLQCKPSPYTAKELSTRLLTRAAMVPGGVDGGPVYLELPEQIEVLGLRARNVVVSPGTVKAVLADHSMQALAATQQLQPHHYPGAEGTWVKPMALRNDGNGWIRQRAITVKTDPAHPTDLLVACSEMTDSRRQQHERAGDDRPLWFTADVAVAALAGELLACRADRLTAVTMTTSLVMKGPPDAPFSGWREDPEGNGLQWTLPTPLNLQGLTVSSVRIWEGVLFGAVNGMSAQQLAQRWGLAPGLNEHGETLYFVELPATVAEDGWEESQTRLVMELEDGTTIAGCTYAEVLPEFGWWPGDEANERTR